MLPDGKRVRWEAEAAGDNHFVDNPYAPGGPKFGFDFNTGKRRLETPVIPERTPAARSSAPASTATAQTTDPPPRAHRSGQRGGHPSRGSGGGTRRPRSKLYSHDATPFVPYQSGSNWAVQPIQPSNSFQGYAGGGYYGPAPVNYAFPPQSNWGNGDQYPHHYNGYRGGKPSAKTPPAPQSK